AVERGRDDAVALTRGGHALGHLAGDLDGGIALIDRARLLNPNFALAWFLGGVLRVFRGELDSGTENLTHAVRLSPLDPEMFRMQAGMALADFFAGRYDSALAWTEKALVDLPSLLVAVALKAASHALAGHAQEAAKTMERLRTLDPSLTLSNLRDWMPIHRPEDFERFSDALRLAGLPER
ncbi:MAG TPA: CadC-family transcriptional regulator, partial [Shinella sp.]|nr:CadC-family transcriptional regulator [Shinella sp.]